jgi:hypothetical protein
MRIILFMFLGSMLVDMAVKTLMPIEQSKPTLDPQPSILENAPAADS